MKQAETNGDIKMKWQYRTIVFEFAKDGLLGEKYIDDEAMEKTLNDQGLAGWELVSVVMVQEGVLAVLKRQGAAAPVIDQEISRSHEASAEQAIEKEPDAAPPDVNEVPGISAEEIQRQEREHIRQLEEQRQKTMEEHERDRIGDIKIS